MNTVETQPRFELTTSRGFSSWLNEQQISLAFTTYQAGKLFLIGMQPDNKLSIFERTFSRCMGLWSNGQTMWMSSLYQLWRFENVIPPGKQAGEQAGGFDRLYVPQVGYTTGDIDMHDVSVNAGGRPIFANTLFSCVATISETHSFEPIWKPPFITKLAAEDRCHLNGLATENGEAAYVTAVAATDAADAWREHRRDGGIVIDCRTNEIVANGLSMPHSPRVYQKQLWMLNAGTGFFGRVDLDSGKFEPLTFCPGFLRGMTFVGDYALVATSKQRDNRTFTALELDDNLAERGAESRCQIAVIDLRTFDLVQWVRIEGVVEELYDVVVLPSVRRPSALGFKTDEIRTTISVDGELT